MKEIKRELSASDEEEINNLFISDEDTSSDTESETETNLGIIDKTEDTFADIKQRNPPVHNIAINKISLFDFVQNDTIDLQSKEVAEFLNLPDCNKTQEIEFNLEYFFHTKNLQSDEQTIIKKSKKTNSRYFGDTRVCYICLRKGHTDQTCPTRLSRCSTCLSTDHQRNDCPMTICMKCYRLGHKFVNCAGAEKSRFFKCRKCNDLHFARDCPDWRVFKVDRMDKVNRKNKKLQCAMCLKAGHLAEDCENKYYVGIFNKYYMKLSKFTKK
ncbi:Zinc finger CCHC domain-containing protein 7 [Cucumispora dikerogammari]|nr:Zinc finger CCHC domain-containing protein 7 [Cucumispora dikerogammari]